MCSSGGGGGENAGRLSLRVTPIALDRVAGKAPGTDSYILFFSFDT